MDFAGFKDPNFGRRGRKAVSSQSAMIVYGIVAAVGVVILILVFSLISKSSSVTTITAENQGLNNQIDSMLQQKSKLAKNVNSVSGDRDKIKNEIKDKRDKETELDNQYKELQKKKDELNNELVQLNEQQNTNEKQLSILQEKNSEIKKKILSFPMDRLTYEQRKNELSIKIIKLQQQIKEKEGQSDSSKILRPTQFRMISNWISGTENLTFKLIFQLTRDKTSDAFHQLCGNEKIKKTMVVVRTSEGDVFGGYTSNNWGRGEFTQDKTAILFNVNNKKKYDIVRPSEAIFTDRGYYSCFGQSDLVLSERACYSKFPNSYGQDAYTR